MTLIPGQTLGVLTIEPSGPHGLLDAAPIFEFGNRQDLPYTENGIARSYACGDLIASGPACPRIDFSLAENAKRFDPVEIVDGTLVTIQGGLLCSMMGLTPEESLSYAEDLFKNRESAAVEREFMDHVLTNAGGGDPAQPTQDLTPAGGPVNVKAGLAIAEGHGMARYAGKPYIHLPATVGSYLAALGSIKIDGMAKTKLDNPAVIGSGYDLPSVGPDGTEAAEGTYWLYVTGRPIIARAATHVHESPKFEMNEQVALAERAYLLGADCFVAAVNVTLEG